MASGAWSATMIRASVDLVRYWPPTRTLWVIVTFPMSPGVALLEATILPSE